MTQIITKTLLIAIIFTVFSCTEDEVDDTIETTDPVVVATDFTTTIDEYPQQGAVLGKVVGTADKGEVVFSIASQSPNGAMAIDAVSGELTVADETLFVFSDYPMITGVVEVSSGDVSAMANVTINLTELITTADFSATVDEYAEQGTVLGVVVGSSSVGEVSFSISEQSPAGALALDAVSGELTIADESAFIYESNPSVTAVVLVSDGIGSNIANVTITVTDVYNLASDRSALIELYNANTGNTLGWDISTTDISLWEGVTLTNQRVIGLQINDKEITEIPSGALAGLNELTHFYAAKNTLMSLDLSGNPKLKGVEIFDNDLTELDISKNTLLEFLLIQENKLGLMDISNLSVLRTFKAESNDFQGQINLANGNNNNMTVTVHLNPGLQCIFVDEGASFAGWVKDDRASYASGNENCGNVKGG